MRGTKLWQSAGSPIIQGRSRTERPFWQDWVAAAVVAMLVVTGYELATSGPYAAVGDALRELSGSVLVSAGASLVPAAALVWLFRKLRWKRPTLVAGVSCAAIVIVYLTFGLTLWS